MLQYGFFDSIEGDRVYGAEDFDTFYEGLLSDGVIRGVASELEVTPGEGMSVMVGTGKAIVGGKWIRNTEPYKLELSPPDSYYNRVDRVILQANYEERKVKLVAKPGTPASRPVLPELQDTGKIKEIELARITVYKNNTTIKRERLLDSRTYASIPNIKNEAIRYYSDNAFFAAIKKDTIGMQFYQKIGQVAVETISVNGSRIVNAELKAENTRVPKSGEGYLGVKILMPPELGNIPTNAPLSVTVTADKGVSLVGQMNDDQGQRFFVLANTEAEEKHIKKIAISYMILDNPEKKEY